MTTPDPEPQRPPSRFTLPLFIAAALLAIAITLSVPAQENTMPANHEFIGLWVTADGNIRQELLANGRYEEARGTRIRAYQGRYEITGTKIFYWDDTGFTADGYFADDILYHAGMIMHRQPAQ